MGPSTLMGFHCDWLCNRKAQLIKSIQSPQLWRQPWPPRTYLQEESLSTIHFLNETLQHFRRTNFVFCHLSLAKCHRHGASKVADSWSQGLSIQQLQFLEGSCRCDPVRRSGGNPERSSQHGVWQRAKP